MEIKTYKSGVIKLKIKKLNEALSQLNKLKSLGVKASPILRDTLEAFKLNMEKSFDSRISPDGFRWKGLTKKYAKIKFREKGNRLANLIWDGTLRNAVHGGLGWFQNISEKKIEFGIRGIPYAAAHQYGNIVKKLPARPYFLAKGNTLPDSVINYMITRIEKEFERIK